MHFHVVQHWILFVYLNYKFVISNFENGKLFFLSLTCRNLVKETLISWNFTLWSFKYVRDAKYQIDTNFENILLYFVTSRRTERCSTVLKNCCIFLWTLFGSTSDWKKVKRILPSQWVDESHLEEYIPDVYRFKNLKRILYCHRFLYCHSMNLHHLDLFIFKFLGSA